MRKMGNVLVVGSSGGFGRVICQALCNDGNRVTGLDIKTAPDNLLNEARFTAVQVDLLDSASLFEAIETHLPEDNLQAVIYAAGVYDHFPLAEGEPNRLDRIIRLNVLAFADIVSFTFQRVKHSHGRYIVISSETALVSLPFQIYGVSKRMLEVYTDALRQELAQLNIPVVSIRPGAHQTALLNKSRELLADYPANSAFKSQLDIVREQGQEVIDRGASDPGSIVPVVMKAITSTSPKASYHVNVALHFRILGLLPAAVVRLIFRVILGRRS